ncbi:MAG: DHH family phosphoesterase, partial [Lachnospiraceae bacterium]|nr:DHH family phosphoesterase [Lachnospiraceae bacterium]
MDLLKEIGNAKSVAVAGHIRPDGDCISSTLAVRNYLLNAKPDLKVTVFTQDNPPLIFSYLK